MQGDPRHFESFNSRLGFQINQDDDQGLRWVWRGARFPGFLCLGIAFALLLLSVPVLRAILIQGTGGTAAALWYFPVMNLFLFCVAVFLLSLRRTIVIDPGLQRVIISKRSLFRRISLTLDFDEIISLRLGTDMVYSGPGVAGSTMGQDRFPSASLRLVLKEGDTVLLDRGSKTRIQALHRSINGILKKPTSHDS